MWAHVPFTYMQVLSAILHVNQSYSYASSVLGGQREFFEHQNRDCCFDGCLDDWLCLCWRSGGSDTATDSVYVHAINAFFEHAAKLTDIHPAVGCAFFNYTDKLYDEIANPKDWLYHAHNAEYSW
jgi:hypothetical protein